MRNNRNYRINDLRILQLFQITFEFVRHVFSEANMHEYHIPKRTITHACILSIVKNARVHYSCVFASKHRAFSCAPER